MMEEKCFAMYVTDLGKRPKPTRPENQVTYGVKNNLEIVMANVGNEDQTNVEHDVQFEIPPAEVEFKKMQTYKVRVEIGLTKEVLQSTTYQVDTGPCQIKLLRIF